MAAKKKTALEVLLSAVDLHGIKLQPRIVKTKRLVTVELLWPRCSIAKKTSAREVEFRKGQASCQGEEWCRRVLFREEVDGHAGLAVAVSEILDDGHIPDCIVILEQGHFNLVCGSVDHPCRANCSKRNVGREY